MSNLNNNQHVILMIKMSSEENSESDAVEQAASAPRMDLERRAFQLVMTSGEKGLLQSELWRTLNATSREGSRISLKLERKGLIKRVNELSEGRWTYRLFAERYPPSLNSIFDTVCIRCGDIERCGPQNTISPNSCKKLSCWLMEI